MTQSSQRILRNPRRKHHHSLPSRGSVVPASLTGYPIPRFFLLGKTKCDVYIRKEVCATVVLSSGTTCAQRIIVRMAKELTMLGPSTMEINAFRVSHEPTALQI